MYDKDEYLNKREGKGELPGIYGNLRGKSGLNMPFCTFQSNGFRLAASNLIKTSSLLGVGKGTSTCWNKYKRLWKAFLI